MVFGPDRAIEQQGSGDDHSFASRGEIRSRASPANGFIQTKADRLIQLEEFLERQKTGGGIKVARRPARSGMELRESLKPTSGA